MVIIIYIEITHVHVHTLLGQDIDWRSEDGQMIAELLLPTTEQVNFAIGMIRNPRHQ